MDIQGQDTTRLALSLIATATNQAVGLAVMQKAMEVQASSAAALISALPPVSGANLPAHLGQNVNTTA